jgi:Ankyrin repeats (3 copies)
MVARIAKSILSSWCIDKTWIDGTNYNGYTVFMQAAKHGHTSVVEVLLADPCVDKSSINHTGIAGHTALILAADYGRFQVAKLLISDCRTRLSWDGIVELTHINSHIMSQRNEIPPLVIAELTRRQMCVIYPSANRLLWPVPAQSGVEYGDDDDDREDSIAQPVTDSETECALITSFFQSRQRICHIYIQCISVMMMTEEYNMMALYYYFVAL